MQWCCCLVVCNGCAMQGDWHPTACMLACTPLAGATHLLTAGRVLPPSTPEVPERLQRDSHVRVLPPGAPGKRRLKAAVCLCAIDLLVSAEEKKPTAKGNIEVGPQRQAHPARSRGTIPSCSAAHPGPSKRRSGFPFSGKVFHCTGCTCTDSSANHARWLLKGCERGGDLPKQKGHGHRHQRGGWKFSCDPARRWALLLL